MHYRYICKDCGAINELERADWSDPDWQPPRYVECDACGGPALRQFGAIGVMDASHATEVQHIGKPTSGHPQMEFVGDGFPGQELRLNDQQDEIEAIMEEEATDEEVQVGKAMMREREEQKGMPEGLISGDRPQEEVVLKKVSPEEYRKQQAKQRQAISEAVHGAEEARGVTGSQDGLENTVPSVTEAGQVEVVGKRTVRQGEDRLRERKEEQQALRKRSV